VRRLAALGLVVVLAVGCSSDGDDATDADAAGPTTMTSTTSAVGELRVVDPITDNYKACFNTDPTAFEPRTWLSESGVVAGDVTYGLPTGTPSSADTVAADGLALVGDDGTSATLVADVGPAEVAANGGLFRVEAVGRFGLLVPIRSREALADDSIVATLTLEAEGGPIAEVEARYDPDAALGDGGPG
jgi:hypothetical protein